MWNCATTTHRSMPFDGTVVPVAVELRRNAESLIEFTHPEDAVYVFGPEDGSLDRAVLGLCHRFVVIPTRQCTNLAAAVYTVRYDRHAKRVAAHAVVGRGFDEPDDLADAVGVE
jgi:tRNA(Leu) C34 or U34 (ribose-2'-O)-methylase TrmL